VIVEVDTKDGHGGQNEVIPGPGHRVASKSVPAFRSFRANSRFFRAVW
jgi:hypothetical protein